MQGGLAAFAWSPDGELVVLVTQQRQLLLMSKVRLPAAAERMALHHHLNSYCR